ncbi:MAG: hypothetical protein KGP28_08305 [Bdellovibrionales bacterium]|nr:hypothetical protein [Bdellovibrionales bacterium]
MTKKIKRLWHQGNPFSIFQSWQTDAELDYPDPMEMMALGILLMYRIIPILLLAGLAMAFLRFKRAPSRSWGALLALTLLMSVIWVRYLGWEIISREWNAALAPEIGLLVPDGFQQPFIVLRRTSLDPESKPPYRISIPPNGIAKVTLSREVLGHPDVKFRDQNGHSFFGQSRMVGPDQLWLILVREGEHATLPAALDTPSIDRAISLDLEAKTLLNSDFPPR